MQIKTHKLHRADGTPVSYEPTENRGGKLKNGKPRFVIIHFTANGSARGTIDYFRNPANRVSAHLVVDHEGAVTQMVPFNERAWHAGASSWMGLDGLNSYSVGIEIVNWGGLQGGPGHWKSWTGKPLPDDRVIEAAHRNNPGHVQGWEIFDPDQVETVAAIVRALGATYGIGAAEVLGHDDIAPRRKSDPGPAWDMTRFRAMIAGRADDAPALETFVVNAQSGLNMRAGPGVEHAVIKLLAKGSVVSAIEANGLWRLVSEFEDGVEGDTGWVHGNWLAPC